MSDLVDLFNISQSPRVVKAREIPGPAVDFIDRDGTYQKEFAINAQRYVTRFTDAALNYFDKISVDYVVPQSFQKIAENIELNRWNSKKKYYDPGNSRD